MWQKMFATFVIKNSFLQNIKIEAALEFIFSVDIHSMLNVLTNNKKNKMMK
jgi:hypothetical protein